MTLEIALKKSFPRFKSRQEEAAFWDTHSFLDFPEQVYPVGDSPDARAYRWLRRKFPERQGWRIAYSPQQHDKIADFIVRDDGTRILVEVKARRAFPSTMVQIAHLKAAFHCTTALLLCEHGVPASEAAMTSAQQLGVRIAWLPEQRASRNSAKRPLKVVETPARYDAG